MSYPFPFVHVDKHCSSILCVTNLLAVLFPIFVPIPPNCILFHATIHGFDSFTLYYIESPVVTVAIFDKTISNCATLALKFASAAIFLFFNQKIAFKKLWKMLFISTKKPFTLPRYLRNYEKCFLFHLKSLLRYRDI